MQSCGHLLHVDCHQSYLKSLQVFSGLLCVTLNRNSANLLRVIPVKKSVI